MMCSSCGEWASGSCEGDAAAIVCRSCDAPLNHGTRA